jgi:hypothetical protein
MSNYNSWQLIMTFDIKAFVCTQAICIRKLRKRYLHIIILYGHCYIKTLKNTFKKFYCFWPIYLAWYNCGITQSYSLNFTSIAPAMKQAQCPFPTYHMTDCYHFLRAKQGLISSIGIIRSALLRCIKILDVYQFLRPRVLSHTEYNWCSIVSSNSPWTSHRICVWLTHTLILDLFYYMFLYTDTNPSGIPTVEMLPSGYVKLHYTSHAQLFLQPQPVRNRIQSQL